jgi:protein-S-isoprenylcysteine O-methyltransferase Ste14
LFGRSLGDIVLIGVTLVELVLLFQLTPSFTPTDWIYVLQHVFVLGVALTRRAPERQDRSLRSNASIVVVYAYPYGQLIYLRWVPGDAPWPEAGLYIVAAGACLSLASLLSLGRRFGVRPALRGLATKGPYRLIRHPMYLAYMIADVGYNLQEWNWGTALMVLVGWVALVYRIHAEERILANDPGWAVYAARVRSRLIPGLW